MWISMALVVPAALHLPHGSLIFWLTSSCFIISWVRAPRACSRARLPPCMLVQNLCVRVQRRKLHQTKGFKGPLVLCVGVQRWKSSEKGKP